MMGNSTSNAEDQTPPDTSTTIEEIVEDDKTLCQNSPKTSNGALATRHNGNQELTLDSCDLKDTAAIYLKENTSDNLRAMTDMLSSVSKPTSLASVVELQVQAKEHQHKHKVGLGETLRVVLEACPKELILVGVPSLVFLLAFLAYTSQLLVLLVTVGLCIGLCILLNHLQQKQSIDSDHLLGNAQLKACSEQVYANQEIVAKLSDKALEMQNIRHTAILKMRELEAKVAETKMAAVKQIHAVEKECQLKIKQLEEEGKTGRESIQKDKEETIAKINADASKMKADIEMKTKLEVEKMELEKSKFAEETRLKEAKIDSETKQFIRRSEQEANMAKIRHEAEQAAAARAHEQSIRAKQIQAENENLRIRMQKEKEVAMAELERDKHGMQQETERVRIEKENSCVIC